jgi:nicotinate-nucleotide pyrophosphorylase (carboxylating)
MDLPRQLLARIVAEALQEDVGPGDITTESTVPATIRCLATIETRQSIVVAGLEVALQVFKQLDGELQVRRTMTDGDSAEPGDVLLELIGNARSLLTGERVALNLLGRLCGIATLTRQFVESAAGSKMEIADTRKTTPGLRALEKYAVALGGGTNHRFGLWDAVLIKDNHVDLAGGIAAAVKAARAALPAETTIEVEVRDVKELATAIDAEADMALLDNLTPQDLVKATELGRGRIKLEVSGGVTIDRIEEIARQGVDRVSIGALTHSAQASDLSMRMTPWKN